MDAGEKLGEELVDRGVEADVVLAIPRGGLPLGREVADRLGVKLDVVVAKKVPAPGNPELAVGAVASDGSRWLNHDMLERLEVSENYLETASSEAEKQAREKLASYRGEKESPDVSGKTVVVVDDGAATGATMIAVVRQLKSLGAEKVLVALPVASRSALELLEKEQVSVVALETPRNFNAVGQFYSDFTQVTDVEAMSFLE